MSILTIAYSSQVTPNGILLRNSQGDSVCGWNSKELLDFLARNYTDALNRKVFWNLDVAVAPILKLLGMIVCKELVKEPDCESLWEFTPNGIKLHDMKEKTKELSEGLYSLYYHRQTSTGLQVYGQRKSYFYNLSQFFESDAEITEPSEILGKAKELVDAFFAMGLNPLKMSSPISVYQSNVLEHIDVPTLVDLPASLSEAEADELVAWSEEIMHREWTTAMAVGHWGKGGTFDYDIQSAYGYFFSELYNYRYATFKKSDTPCKEADFGLLKGKVTINAGVKCSPICYKQENGQTINPVDSTWPDILTLPEVRWIYRRGIGTFKMDYGYFWKQNAPVQPFKVSMQRIFDHRLKGGLVKTLAKRIGASAWAKCIQKATSDGVNKFYSPLLALQVKTNCRLKVADFIYDHSLQDSVIHIGTDGTRATRKATISDKVGMGEWRESGSDPCILLSPGRIYTPTHKPGGLFYDDIIRMINEKPKEAYYATSLTRPVTLGEAVEMGDLHKVGEVSEFQTSIDLITLRQEQDMEFDELPFCGKDLLEKKYYGQPIKV